MGDVLRSTPLLFPLKEKYPQSYITWLTDPASSPLLINNKYIDRMMTFSLEDVLSLLAEKFDMLINLEKEQRAIALAHLIEAPQKIGFALNEFGTLGVYNKESEYALLLGLSDELKFKQNQKTYQQIIFEMCGFNYKGEEYILELTEAARERERAFRQQHNLDRYRYVVGVHTGSGSVFPTKQWTVEGWRELLAEASRFPDTAVVLIGGPAEKELNRHVLEASGREPQNLMDAGCDNSVEEFLGIVNCCDLVVGLDSLAMHVALGLKKKVVALFGPTCHQEIDFYNRGKFIIGQCDIRPCYRNVCTITPRCMEKISGAEVARVTKELLFDDSSNT